MTLSDEDLKIEADALAYAKSIRRAFSKDATDQSTYLSEEAPVSVFMAGSPGAGKTEASIALIDSISSPGQGIVRIDPDELRQHFEEYEGSNAHLFQKAVSILVEKIHDLVLKQKQSFLLDGTLSNYGIAIKNIDRSLSRKRLVQILYVYQEPQQAWNFVLAREVLEGRKILAEHFVGQYFEARNVVNRLKEKYGQAVSVDLLLKNIDGSNKVYQANVDSIDNYIPEKYSRTQIEQMLGIAK